MGQGRLSREMGNRKRRLKYRLENRCSCCGRKLNEDNPNATCESCRFKNKDK